MFTGTASNIHKGGVLPVPAGYLEHRGAFKNRFLGYKVHIKVISSVQFSEFWQID